MSVPYLERPEDPELHRWFVSPARLHFQALKELLDSLSTTPRAALYRSGRTVYLVSAPQKPQLEGWSYCGEVWTDARGRAVAALPPFAHNHRAGFHYELTPVGTECAARVVEEIENGRFAVETDEPHVKVAWRVTPLRETSDS